MIERPELTREEWAALAAAFRYAVVRGGHSEGLYPAVAVRLAGAAWAQAAVKLSGAGLLRLWDKLAGTLAFCETVPHFATHAEEAPKTGSQGPDLPGV